MFLRNTLSAPFLLHFVACVYIIASFRCFVKGFYKISLDFSSICCYT
nr:MAG TPA: hypothetical protein [Caudoviricetes sp.]